METAAGMKASVNAKKPANSKKKPTETQPRAPQEVRFVPETPDMPPGKKRIPPEKWKSLKGAIVYKYKVEGKALPQVMREMMDEHNFVATQKQYRHQLGKAPGKWNILKYKTQPSASTSTRTLDIAAHVPVDMDTKQRKALMADVLHAGGYSGAYSLYHDLLLENPHDVVSLRKNLFHLCRATQTHEHAEVTLGLLDQYVDKILQAIEGEGPLNVLVSLFDIMLPRIQHDTSNHGAGNTAAQIEGIVRSESHPRFKDHHTLLLFYVHLSYALARWNELGMGDDSEADRLLRSFIDKQLGPSGTHPIIVCLQDCLAWCSKILDQNPQIPASLQTPQPDSFTAVYQVIATLWRAYATSTPAPSWASGSETSSRISPAELLVTLICTAMAATDSDSETMDCAREGFHALAELGRARPRQLLDGFLDQLRRTSDPRMLAPRIQPANTVPSLHAKPVLAAFLGFVTDTLEVAKMPPGDAAPIHPVVLGEEEESDDDDDEGVDMTQRGYRGQGTSQRGRVALPS